MSTLKKSIYSAICVALAIILPIAFHSIPNAGNVFCPMHLPILICGLICGWNYGLLCGIIAPALSSLISGMPPAAILPGMMLELAIYGFVCGIMIKAIHTNNIYADLYASLIVALLIGRIAAGIAHALLFSAGDYSIALWATGYFVTCLPGIIIQLIFIPSIIFALQKSHLIPAKYPEVRHE